MTDKALARPIEAPQNNELLDPNYILALFEDSDEQAKRVMSNIAYALQDDPSNIALWEKALETAQRMDSRSGSDGYKAEEITGNRENLQVWITNCQDIIKEKFIDIAAYRVNSAFDSAKTSPNNLALVDFARTARHSIGARRIEVAATEIMKVREAKLRERFRLRQHYSIPSKAYQETVYYASCTLKDLMAYIQGERADAIFSIDGPQDPTATAAVEDLTRLTSGRASEIEVEDRD